MGIVQFMVETAGVGSGDIGAKVLFERHLGRREAYMTRQGLKGLLFLFYALRRIVSGIIGAMAWELYSNNSESTLASTALTWATMIDPSNPAPHYRHGSIQVKNGKLNEALTAFSRAIQLDPNFCDAYEARGEVYRRLGRIDMAALDFGHVNELNSSMTVELQTSELASSYESSGDDEQAKTFLDKAIEDQLREVKKVDTYSAYMQGKGQKRASRLALVRLYCQRAFVLAEAGNHQNALDDYERAIRISPNDAEARRLRGEMYTQLGDFESAMRDYNDALLISPASSEAHISRAALLGRLGRLADAMTDLNMAIKLKQYNSRAYYQRGHIHEMLTEIKAAYDDYTMALTLDPRLTDSFLARATLHFCHGNYESAAKDWQRAIANDPTNVQAVIGLAVARYRLGNADEAKQLWRTLITQDERYRDADWTGKELNWVTPMTDAARELIATLDADDNGT
jgi:tetratricopeptide (TPR) repeat protein